MSNVVPLRRLPVEVQKDPEPEPSVRHYLRGAIVVVVVFFGFAGGWAFLSSLDSASYAPGVVNVDGYRKAVQHLEGGIITSIQVKEGDQVKQGQVLLTISDVQSRAALEQTVEQFYAVQARIVRLEAEKRDSRTLEFPEKLVEQATRHGVTRVLDDQRALFVARWAAYDSDVKVIREQAAQAGMQAETLKARENTALQQLAFLREEMDDMSYLFSRGLERKPRVMAARRLLAQIEGARDEARADYRRATRALEIAELQVAAKRNARAAEIATDLDTAQTALAEQSAKAKAFNDAQRRTEVRSPADGVVMNVKNTTLGGVVGPGQTIMEIVPAREGILIDAQVNPNDIDDVHPGLRARIRLVAYSQRRTPVISGVVETVTADRIVDEKTGTAYFKAKVRPSEEDLRKLQGVTLTPGMPVEVLITTGRRRVIDYFVAPIADTMSRSMIEH